jgi:hypothetical protein
MINLTTEKNEMMVSSIKESYEITQNAEGKFQRKAVYQPFSSIVPVTKEEKINMMNLLNGDDVGQPLGENIGKQFQIADVIFNPYDKVNEETGEMEFGVLSYLITPENIVYVTSSKSVYFSLKRIFQVFGEPHYSEDEVITIQAVKKKGQQFQYTDIKIVG